MMYVTKKLLGKGNELSIHKLKHTHATLLLESNVPMKVIQERLGHKSEAITSDVYSHVTKKWMIMLKKILRSISRMYFKISCPIVAHSSKI